METETPHPSRKRIGILFATLGILLYVILNIIFFQGPKSKSLQFLKLPFSLGKWIGQPRQIKTIPSSVPNNQTEIRTFTGAFIQKSDSSIKLREETSAGQSEHSPAEYTVLITPSTQFSLTLIPGFNNIQADTRHNPPTLDDLIPGDTVTVQFDDNLIGFKDDNLTATSLFIIPPANPTPTRQLTPATAREEL